MKNLVKKTLQRLHLLDHAAILYNNLKLIGHFSILREIQLRFKRPPDRLPLPPTSLIFKVIGHGWRSIFFDSGKIIVDHILHNLTRNHIEIEEATRILDFGCGCGRLLRHLYHTQKAQYSGTDFNEKLIQWCRENFTFGNFTVNRLDPPLSYPPESFDLIYAQSVFTHLNEDLQLRWLAEFHRLLKMEGILYFTTHGRQFIYKLNDRERNAFHSGEVVVQHLQDQGKNICGAFQLPAYFEQKIKSGFNFLDFIPGKDEIHLQQDINIFKKTDEPFNTVL